MLTYRRRWWHLWRKENMLHCATCDEVRGKVEYQEWTEQWTEDMERWPDELQGQTPP